MTPNVLKNPISSNAESLNTVPALAIGRRRPSVCSSLLFARHGYCFKKKELRQQFENEDWYIPNTVDIKNYLTDIEKTNIALIKRYEKSADEYGDEYGR